MSELLLMFFDNDYCGLFDGLDDAKSWFDEASTFEVEDLGPYSDYKYKLVPFDEDGEEIGTYYLRTG
jgi:hypothetical protein